MERYLNQLKARLFIGLLGFLSVIFAFFSIFLLRNNFILFALPQCFFLVVNLFLMVFLWNWIPMFNKLIALHPVYMLTAYCVIILNAFVYWKGDSIGAIYYFCIPPCVMLFLTNGRTTFYYAVFGMILLMIVVFLNFFLSETVIIHFTEQQLLFLGLAHLITFFLLIVYIAFCLFMMERAREKFEHENTELLQHENDKYFAIYEGIISAMENEKIWQDAELSVLELADHLNTNVNYVYHALKHFGKDESFSNMINRYRIQAIKERILHGEGEKFTINHLYMQSGFKNQSTFNRVFKQFENVTPKEYIKLAKSHKRQK